MNLALRARIQAPDKYFTDFSSFVIPAHADIQVRPTRPGYPLSRGTTNICCVSMCGTVIEQVPKF